MASKKRRFGKCMAYCALFSACIAFSGCRHSKQPQVPLTGGLTKIPDDAAHPTSAQLSATPKNTPEVTKEPGPHATTGPKPSAVTPKGGEVTGSVTPKITGTPTPSGAAERPKPTPTKTPTPSPTPSPIPSTTPEPTEVPTPTVTPMPTATPIPTLPPKQPAPVTYSREELDCFMAQKIADPMEQRYLWVMKELTQSMAIRREDGSYGFRYSTPEDNTELITEFLPQTKPLELIEELCDNYPGCLVYTEGEDDYSFSCEQDGIYITGRVYACTSEQGCIRIYMRTDREGFLYVSDAQ